MDIGEVKRVFTVEPIITPVPAEPNREQEPNRVEPEQVPEQERESAVEQTASK